MIYSVHYNPDYFPEPHKFKPSRFLESDGITPKRDEHLIPFGMGKRMCLGESLARMEIFLILSSLLQRYRFSVPENREPPTLKARRGATLTPYPYECKIEHRNS